MTFHLPTKLIFGTGTLKYISRVTAKIGAYPMITTGRSAMDMANSACLAICWLWRCRTKKVVMSSKYLFPIGGLTDTPEQKDYRRYI